MSLNRPVHTLVVPYIQTTTQIQGVSVAKVMFTVRLPRELKLEVEKHKERTGESQTDTVITALKQYLNLK